MSPVCCYMQYIIIIIIIYYGRVAVKIIRMQKYVENNRLLSNWWHVSEHIFIEVL